MTLLNYWLDIHNFFTSDFPLTIRIIANPRLFLVIYTFLGWSSLMYYCGIVFRYTLVDYSTFCFKSSIFLLSRYFLRNILYTLNYYKYSNISFSTTAESIIVTIQVSKFDSRWMNYLALVRVVSKTDITYDKI